MAEAAILDRPRDGVAGGQTRRVSPLLTLVVPCALAALALFLRLHDISRQTLWLDEGYTLLFSRMSLDRLLLVGGAHEHPPLYYLLVHTLLSVHDSYLVPRVLSAVFG